MKLRQIKSNEIEKNAKSSIHKSGKLGFSGTATRKLRLENGVNLVVSINEDDAMDENLYVAVLKEDAEGAFKVVKAGDYYYCNTKALFDQLGVDYRSKTIIYDIVDFEFEGQKMFKFLKREVAKRRAKQKSEA
jgi:hypothetical protein